MAAWRAGLVDAAEILYELIEPWADRVGLINRPVPDSTRDHAVAANARDHPVAAGTRFVPASDGGSRPRASPGLIHASSFSSCRSSATKKRLKSSSVLPITRDWERTRSEGGRHHGIPWRPVMISGTGVTFKEGPVRAGPSFFDRRPSPVFDRRP